MSRPPVNPDGASLPRALDAISDLLRHRREGEVQRGLYRAPQLEQIREELAELGAWLRDNRSPQEAETDLASESERRFDQRTALCIAYPDHVKATSGQPPAQALRDLFNSHLTGLYTHLHVLPHFPSPIIHPDISGPPRRADGGFEATSYKMDPAFGVPDDLREIEAELMFDFVLNHLSSRGEWFARFIDDDPDYRDFFVELPANRAHTLDLAPVFRPRPHHPVFAFDSPRTGQTKHVWCTFSRSQADLNFKSPRVLIEIFRALCRDFVGQGASWIRLDAIGYLVKMIGLAPDEPVTSCFGIEETHAIVKAMRRFLEAVAPSVTLVAEVNARAEEIATYFGEDRDEAHMVYEFPVAPLSLFATYTGDARPLLDWAEARTNHPDRIGLAFTSSHDGIGVQPMADCPPLPDGTTALDHLLDALRARGAGVNQRRAVIDGRPVEVPYEACLTWTQALLTPDERDALTRDSLRPAAIVSVADRFVASQSACFYAPHVVPADYLGAIAGLLNDEETCAETGHNRDKNRGQIDPEAFSRALTAPRSNRERLVRRIFEHKRRMLLARQGAAAFSPYARCSVGVATVTTASAEPNPVFSVLRHSPEGAGGVLCLTNYSAEPRAVIVDTAALGASPGASLTDILSDRAYPVARRLELTLAPYQVAWLAI